VIDAEHDEARLVPGGGFSTHHANIPYALTPPREHAGFHANVVAIPFARCESLIGHTCKLDIRPLAAETGMTSLFGSYFRAFVEQAPSLKGTAAEIAVETLLQLALVARGVASTKAEATRDAIHAGQLEAVRQFMGRNLTRGDLTPSHAAQAIGISVRQLHLLFEPTGTTFARYLLAQRLNRVRHLLALQPHRPVIDIAFACGIESQTVFYRAFRQAFGMSPSDYRALHWGEQGE
jgi:AraC-like DNA-binding protein